MDPITGTAIVGIVITEGLKTLFQKLDSNAVLDFFKATKVDDTKVEHLKMLLLSLTSIDEVKLITNQRVKELLEKVRDAACDAEDLLDEVNTEAMQRQLGKKPHLKRTNSKLNRSSRWLSIKKKLHIRNIFRRLPLGAKLNKLLQRLEGITKMINPSDLNAVGLPASNQETTSSPDGAVYGREEDIEYIVKLLLAENSCDASLDVIIIKGMVGIGKTTVAQLIFNDSRIVKHFDFKAWLCLSKGFDVAKVTRTLLETITPSSPVTGNLDHQQNELCKNLADKKFFLVLDDVWNEIREHWGYLKKPLQRGAKGGKILVTTRNEGVAQIMRTVPTHCLNTLSYKDCWKLFATYAFEGGESHARPSFRQVGQEIVKKCEGLPLAAKALGSLLRHKTTIEEWNKIEKSNMCNLRHTECDLLLRLQVSYHNLPSHLKSCFAIASVFPKDYQFSKEEIILLWAAQSLIPQTDGENMVDIGGEYFNELISRSLFQQSNDANSSLFRMPSSVHDFATFLSGKSCSCVNRGDIQNITKVPRHMSYFRMSTKRFQTLPARNTLRTLIQLESGTRSNSIGSREAYFYREEISDNLLKRFKFLRVLSLRDYEIKVLPESIGSLKHLRYFDLSRTTIKKLPNSICNLYNLQTLILESCSCLIQLPTDMWKLVNLQYLDVTGCDQLIKMPRNMDKVKNLKLGIFKVRKDRNGTNIGELEPLSNLRGELSIVELQNVESGDDAAEARLKDKKYVEKLKLSWNSGQNGPREEYQVLEKLQPHTSLKELTIDSYGFERFPNWIEDQMYTNMKSLNLENCKYCQSIPMLGQLPSLKKLCISGFSRLRKWDPSFYGNNSPSFGSLEILWIENMPQWEEWSHIDGKAFPHLQELHLKRCPKLREKLPAQLPTLKSLTIECQQLDSSLPEAPALSYLSLQNSNEMLLNHLPQGLQSLEIQEFDLLTSLPQALFSSALKSLKIDRCDKFELPTHQMYASLERLTIESSCDSLQSFPLQNFPNLVCLEIKRCSNLEYFSVPDGTNHDFLPLTRLCISECEKFLGFQDWTFPNLRYFSFQNNLEAKELPYQIETFQFLRTFSLCNCPKIEELPGGRLPSSLTSLEISYCEKFVEKLLDWDLHGLNSLRELFISSRCQGVVSFPVQGLLPESLSKLRINYFDDLETLEYKGFRHLGSLSELTVEWCPKLKCIPPRGLPASLTALSIKECLLLEPRLRRDSGVDWNKIAHIPRILINDKQVLS